MVVGLGVDLVPIERIARMLERWGDRFEGKVFTDGERAYARGRAKVADHFAARFAAKEALLKALGVPEGLEWHQLEVVVGEGGRPSLALHGAAAEAMRARGVDRLHLTLTHAGGHAAAVVVAEGHDPVRPVDVSDRSHLPAALAQSAGDVLGEPLVTAAQMRALDDETIRGLGVPGVVLMESAGRGVVDSIVRQAEGRRRPVAGMKVAVVAGPGNNGGDGYVIARHLANRGAEVTVIRCADEAQVRGDARVHHDSALRSGVPFVDGTAPGFTASATDHLDGADLIVDALLGTGVARPVTGHLATVIERMNAAPGLRVAVDLPSGLDADSGQPLGVAVRADRTVSFAFAKLGLVGSPGFLHAGELEVVDIGIPRRLLGAGARAWLLDERCLAPLRSRRARTAHKGSFGHLLVVAGSRGHTGAALLAGQAAARAGSGLVTIASPDEAQAALQAKVVEVMTAGLGAEPLDEVSAWSALEALLAGKRAVALGPGVERSVAMRGLLARLLARWEGPLVIDADGLNLLAEDLPGSGLATARGSGVVLTPHPAEMARLAGVTTDEVQADRVGVARAFAAAQRVVVVLKGARTVIAAPDGRIAINPTGNPGLATGGTGDVLTGIVGALLASGLDPFAAAAAAAYLHGAAGDRVAAAQGEVGLLASDLIAALPRAIQGSG